ncbi:hypothetical protein EMCRGX_G013786 [Ephydatia muelleri]|eukprot:Em0004g1355a
MGDGDDSPGCSSIILKFVLFFMNCLVLLIGLLLLTIGGFVQTEKTFSELTVQSVLSNPAIILIIAGSILVILGVCGCIGALLEVYVLLIIYGCVLAIIAILLIAALVVFVVKKDIINTAISKAFDIYIDEYYQDVDTQNIVDLLQSTFQCCGSVGLAVVNQTTRLPAPHSWEANPYFNCSSPAYQKCSVPYSCCLPPSGNSTAVINLQCGYNTLNPTGKNYLLNIQTTGCVDRFSQLATSGQNFNIIIGVVSGIILVIVINAAIAFSVARDVYQEKKAFRQIKTDEKRIMKGN